MAVDNISAWNAKVGGTISYIGANGIHYEYLMPKQYDGPWQENALTVRSKKSANSDYANGKRPGQYQPIGGHKYFTYYQMKHLQNTVEPTINNIVMEVR